MKVLWIFIGIITNISRVLAVFSPNCVTPPLKCPNNNITFWLYTRENKNNPMELKAMEPESIKQAPWVKNAPIKILIHGYTGHKNFSPNTEIRPGLLKKVPIVRLTKPYLECCNYNIISVDYNKIALEPCYLEAAQNTELVGMCTAQLIDEMVTKHGFRLIDFHVIGFSLGGQTAGFIANYLKAGKLPRISALDPAMPMFATMDNRKKIDSSDAEYVDVLHTNALEKGKLENSGHSDYYANFAYSQPGCVETKNQTKSGCNHARAPLYFAESITTKTGFYAIKCHSLIAYLLGWCDILSLRQEVLYGEYGLKNTSGIFFFRTNPESPYAMGKNFS